MSKISEQKALEAYPDKYIHTPFGINIADINDFKREGYTEGYDQAIQNIFDYIEANIPCGEMSSEDVRDFIIECKEYFKEED